jgi:hypothetical protein
MRRLSKKSKQSGKTVKRWRYHHSFKEVSQNPSEMVDKNGFITLDANDSNYWNFEYVSSSLILKSLFAKVTIRELKFCYDEDVEQLRVKVSYRDKMPKRKSEEVT